MNIYDRTEGIEVLEQIESGHHRCMLEKVMVYKKIIYLFKSIRVNKGESSWDIYQVTKKDYRNMRERIHAYEEQDCSKLGFKYLGQCPCKTISEEWVYERQMQAHIFGELKFREREIIPRKFFLILLIIGVFLLFIGTKQLIYLYVSGGRLESTEGEIYKYYRDYRFDGQYYDVHVRYTVDDKGYEGYSYWYLLSI